MTASPIVRVRAIAIAQAIGLVVAPLGAQARPTPPVAKPAPVYAFPKVQTRTLANGLVVQIVENHALPLVAVRIVIDGGTLLDPPGKEGLYALGLALLRDGTTSMNGEQLSQAIDQLGASVTAINFTGVADELAQALPLMGEMLMHPTFPAEAVDQRKAATISGLQRAEGIAASVANRVLNAVLFGPDNPLGRSSSPASVAAITRDDLVRFHDANVRPQNVTLVIVGDVTPMSVMPLATRVFGRWEKTASRTEVKLQGTLPAQPTTIYLVDRPGAAQTALRMGQVGPMRSSPDYYALDFATAVLGGPPGSRLSQSLREQHALTYSVTHFAAWRGWNDPSAIIGQAQVDAAKTDSAVLVWMGELKDIVGSRPISEQELVFGRSVTVGNLATRYETFDALADRVAFLSRDHLPMSFIDEYVRHINATSAADASKAIAKYLTPDRTAIVVVGDRKTIEAPLRAANIGPVVIVDANGKPIPQTLK
jgi:zinc protease